MKDVPCFSPALLPHFIHSKMSGSVHTGKSLEAEDGKKMFGKRFVEWELGS
jgi:hypothetical protein